MGQEQPIKLRKRKRQSCHKVEGSDKASKGAYLHKDFLKAKRNQSQQEERDELASTRRNFLRSQEQLQHEAKESGQHARRQNSGENVDAETNRTPKYGNKNLLEAKRNRTMSKTARCSGNKRRKTDEPRKRAQDTEKHGQQA